MFTTYTSSYLNQKTFVGTVVFIIILVLAIVVAKLLDVILKVNSYLRSIRSQSIFIELTPPPAVDRTVLATEELFRTIHGLDDLQSWTDRLIHDRVIIALEIVSTLDGGIRYIAELKEKDLSTVTRNITSYMPDIKIRKVKDYLPNNSTSKIKTFLDFKLINHFAYPLRSSRPLDEHDPVNYLTGVITSLKRGELIAIQLVVSPTKVYEASLIEKRLLAGKNPWLKFRRDNTPPIVIRTIINISRIPLRLVLTLSSKLTSRSSRLVLTNDMFEEDVIASVYQKLIQPLFHVNVRILIITNTKKENDERVRSLKSLITASTITHYQAIRPRSGFPKQIKQKWRNFSFKYRLPSILNRGASLLTSKELAGIYHFPEAESGGTDNVIKSLSRTLPAPISLKSFLEPDIIIGNNHHHNINTPIGLSSNDRERHVYIVGGTGNGKTTLLQYAVIQDIEKGKGVAVIDPHGDLAEDIIKLIPENRIQDVIYFNPDDLDYPIGINLMELYPGLEGNELEREKDLVTESVISVFRKIFSDDDSGGHRIEYILRNTIHTALTQEDATIFTILELLTNPRYRNRIVKSLKDENLKNFWQNEIAGAGSFQRVKMLHGITAKIGRFERSASVHRIMSQPKSTIDFEEILNSKKILICNFSKGLLGDDTSALFGTTVLAKLQTAALRRTRQQQVARQPFYLYVDEFQNFATPAFVQMLSEARKYKLFLTMAEQSTSQQADGNMVNTILANVGTVICFRTGSPADERLLLPLFKPYIQEGEIAYLPAYNFYIKISSLEPQEPLSGRTILNTTKGTPETAEKVVLSSRKQYAGNKSGNKNKSDEKQEVIYQPKPSVSVSKN